MRLEGLEKKVLKHLVENDGVTVGEVVESLVEYGFKKYDTYKTIESLASKGLVKLIEEPSKFDPYSPAWSRTVYVTEEGIKHLGSEEKTCDWSTLATLVLTHPFPTETNVKYLSFTEAVELLFSEGDEVVGVVGFVNVNSLSTVVSSILQKLRKPLSIQLLCTKIIPEESESSRRAVEVLRAMGVRLELVEVQDEYGRSLHAKFLTSGDLSYVGSHNLLAPALSRNLEVGLLVKDEELASELRKIFFELRRHHL